MTYLSSNDFHDADEALCAQGLSSFCSQSAVD